MRAVGQEFGLSASAMANVCRKHDIPVPSVGHWTKIEVGHKITPPALMPELSGNEAVHIYVRERLSPELALLAAVTESRCPKGDLSCPRIEDGQTFIVQ
jgi:hypothetical protein